MFPSQAAPAPAAPPPQAQPPASSGNADAAKLHQLALGAEKNLEQLATALAHAGADPQATNAVAQMADVMRKIITHMVPAQSAAPQQPQQHTMASATDALHAQLMAQQGQ